jgi:hypothetical protein
MFCLISTLTFRKQYCGAIACGSSIGEKTMSDLKLTRYQSDLGIDIPGGREYRMAALLSADSSSDISSPSS